MKIHFAATKSTQAGLAFVERNCGEYPLFEGERYESFRRLAGDGDMLRAVKEYITVNPGASVREGKFAVLVVRSRAGG